MSTAASFRRLVAIVSGLSLAASVNAQRPLVPSLPSPPGAREALFGSIAPDGRSFVYEVIEGQERTLWRLNFGTHEALRISPTTGVRYHPAWSPDSKHLAYWVQQPLGRVADGTEGLYVLDLESLEEHRILQPENREVGLVGDVAWLSDGRILYRRMIDTPDFRDFARRLELHAIRIDGTPAPTPSLDDEVILRGVLSPSSTRVAWFGTCCGGGKQALWVRGSGIDRCVAGPFTTAWSSAIPIAWARDERRLYLLARGRISSDTLDHAFAVDLRREVSWRIGPPDLAVASISVSSTGNVAITTVPDSGRVGSLWIEPSDNLRAPPPKVERLQNCPPLPNAITDFVEHSDLKSVHAIDPIFEDSLHQLTVFTVTHGHPCDIYPTRTGIRYQDRIGWIEVDELCRSSEATDSLRRLIRFFPLRSTDTYLFSESLDAQLRGAQAGGVAAALLRAFVTANPQTPFAVIVREVERDASTLSRYALQNPVVTNGTNIPFGERLRLAALSDTLAVAAIGLSQVRSNPERLAQIADLPRYRSEELNAAFRAHERMRSLTRSFITHARTLSERAALHVYMATQMWQPADSLASELLHTLPPQRNRTLFALFATRWASPGDSDIAYARAALQRLGTTPEQEMLDAIERVRRNELPDMLPEFIVEHATPSTWRAVDAISRLDERFLRVRSRAAFALITISSTPDTILMLLGRDLERHSDPLLGTQLFSRASQDRSLIPLVRAIAELDSTKYWIVRDARERLKQLGMSVAPTADSGTTPTSRPATSGAHVPEPTQCRASDDWADQLRRAIGSDAIVLDTLCARAVAALDTAFELPVSYDSAYVLGVSDGYVLAFAPARPEADVTLVRFDTAFVERSRRVVRIH